MADYHILSSYSQRRSQVIRSTRKTSQEDGETLGTGSQTKLHGAAALYFLYP